MADVTISDLTLNESIADADVFERERDLAGTPQNVRHTASGLATYVATKITPADIGAATTAEVAAAQGDATQALADAAQAIADAAAAQSDADAALAAATGAQPVRLITSNASITSADIGKLLLVAVSGSDITLTFADSCVAEFACTVVRSYTAGSDPGGAVIFAGASGTHVFDGATRLSSSHSMIRLVLAAIDGTTRYWNAGREAAHLYIPIQSAHTTSTKTLATYESGRHQALDTSSNSIAISIPDTLRAGFVWTGRKSSASNSVTFATGGGLITPTFYGSSTITANGALICVFVESSTVATVSVTVPA